MIEATKNTSVHFPDDLLEALDRMAARRGVTRNRVIVESCRRAVAAWKKPEAKSVEKKMSREEFFSDRHLSRADLRLLRRGHADFDRALARARRSRRTSPL